MDEVSGGYNVSVLLDAEITYDIRYIGYVVYDEPVYDTQTIIAEIYTYPRQDGGKSDPFIEGYNPSFRFGNQTLDGYFTFKSHDAMVMPGDYVEEIYINLEKDIDVTPGTKFDIIENGTVIGYGTVTGIK